MPTWVKVALVLATLMIVRCEVEKRQPKEVSVCNTYPATVLASIAHKTKSKDFKSVGWFEIQAGDCNTFEEVYGSKFYVYAQSFDTLAKWLEDGKPFEFKGRDRFCYDPSDRFLYELKEHRRNSCENRIRMSEAKLKGRNPTVFIFDDNHRNWPLEEVSNLRADLLGVMQWENFLINNPGRESVFSVGVSFAQENNTSGCPISGVQRGMPAYHEGIVPGDIIVGLDGYKIENCNQVPQVLDAIPFDRTGYVQMSILREGEKLNGSIEPKFFPFNHRLYESTKGVTAIWEFFDAVPLLFGNELACGAGEGLKGIARVINDSGSSGDDFGEGFNDCSNSLNRRQDLYRLLHEDAATAGAWASMLVGAGLLKAPATQLAKQGGKNTAKQAAKSKNLANKTGLGSRSRKVHNPSMKQRSFGK